MNFYHPSPQYPILFACTCKHGEQFCTEERRIGLDTLGVITVWCGYCQKLSEATYQDWGTSLNLYV